MFSKIAIIATTALALSGAAALADSGGVATKPLSGGMSAYERNTAKAWVNPLPAPDASQAKALAPVAGITPGGVSGSVDGSAPVAPPSYTTRAYGSFGIPYTSGRVQIGATNSAGITGGVLSASWPYRAIGRLTFRVGSSGAVCSASLIRRSVLVTAAHCAAAFGGGTSGWYNSWQFTPGFYQASSSSAAIAPYGVWSASRVALASAWLFGTDTGSGAARNNDLAVIILNKNGNGQFLGNITGYLGYGWNNYSFVSSSKTGNLATAAISTLGYPCLLDGCRIMQRTDGPTYLTTVGGALQYWQGSNLTGGSSGGPWLTNFRSMDPVFTGGANAGFAPNNAVVGVTSWGSADPNTIKDNYSSRFGQNTQFPNASYGTVPGAGNIGFLLNYVCGLPGPGGASYLAQGYCN